MAGQTTKSAMFAIVSHWVTEEWNAREAVLHIAEVNGSHTGVALAEEVLRCLQFYDITNKLIAVTSDNASNSAALIKILGKLIMRPRSRNLEDDGDEFDISTDGTSSDFEDDGRNIAPGGPGDVNPEDDSMRAIIYAEDNHISVDPGNKSAMVPSRPLFQGERSWARCLAHSLNLIVMEVLSKLDFQVSQNVDNDEIEV
ncbi:hypothetical protein V1515DRAFT_297564 [Lipomyces mesembrius]